MTAYAFYAVGLLVVIAIVLVVAAIYDRRRGRQIERDPSRLPPESPTSTRGQGRP